MDEGRADSSRTLKGGAMFDHLLNDEAPELEKFDFAVLEIRVNGVTVWERGHGLQAAQEKKGL